MRWPCLAPVLLAVVVLAALPARAQIPAEWQAAAQVVIGELERDTPQAARPWGAELRQGWALARAWLGKGRAYHGPICYPPGVIECSRAALSLSSRCSSARSRRWRPTG